MTDSEDRKRLDEVMAQLANPALEALFDAGVSAVIVTALHGSEERSMSTSFRLADLRRVLRQSLEQVGGGEDD